MSGRPASMPSRKTPAATSASGFVNTPMPHSSGSQVRAPARQQRQPAHREAHGEQERRLAPGEVHDHDDGQRPGRSPRRDPPAVAQVEVEQHRQRPAGEHGDDDAGDELREPVVHEAVGERAVGAAVPVVVPQHRLAVAEQGDLVEVGGVVAPGDAEQVHGEAGERQRRDRGDERARPASRGPASGRPAGRAGRRPASSRRRLPRLHRRHEARGERGAAGQGRHERGGETAGQGEAVGLALPGRPGRPRRRRPPARGAGSRRSNRS